MELDVGCVEVRPRAEEAPAFGIVRGERPAALALEEREVLRREDPEEPGLVGEVVDVDHAVVLEVPADGKLLPHGDPEQLELLGGPDPGEHQQHRRLVRAGGEDHLALGADGLADAGAHELDADGAVALEDEPLDEHTRDDLEVRPALRRMEEGVGGRAAQAVPLRELEA